MYFSHDYDIILNIHKMYVGRLKYQVGMENVTDEGFPTTVKLDFFSGYTFVGITEPFGKTNSYSGWKTESRYNFALIHLRKVSNGVRKIRMLL